MTRFNIGDAFWAATFDSEARWETCPDCGGTKHIRCILFDGSEVTIDCAGCAYSYEPARGVVKTYLRIPRARRSVVTGMEIDGEKVTYKSAAGWHTQDADAYDTEVAALHRAAEIAAEYDQQEAERLKMKEKPARAWAWHVHYHRRAIKEAEKQLAYHTGKLNVAKIKAKEPA